MEVSVHWVATVALAVMLAAVAGQVPVRLVGELVTAPRLTVPAKLSVLARLTEIAAPVAPELKLTGVPTDTVKSPTWTINDDEWEAVPSEPAPVMVTK